MIAIRGFFSGRLPLRQTATRWATGSDAGASRSDKSVTANGATGQCAVIIHSGEARNTLLDGSRLYAIAGNPAWRDSDLADIAARDGNAAALAFAWRRAGIAAFETMTGGYVVAVIDCDDDYLLLSVDRMGIGRLAYTEREDGVVFSHKVGDVAYLAKDWKAGESANTG